METFLSGRYKADINADNPLGMGGKLATAFGSLMEKLWHVSLGHAFVQVFCNSKTRVKPWLRVGLSEWLWVERKARNCTAGQAVPMPAQQIILPLPVDPAFAGTGRGEQRDTAALQVAAGALCAAVSGLRAAGLAGEAQRAQHGQSRRSMGTCLVLRLVCNGWNRLQNYPHPCPGPHHSENIGTAGIPAGRPA